MPRSTGNLSLKWDVSDVDPGQSAGSWEPAPIGIHPAKIREIAIAQPEGKDTRLEIIAECTDGNYGWLYEYINLESPATKWKLDQFLMAVGESSEKKRSGETKLAKIKGRECQVKVKHEEYNDTIRAKPEVWLPADGKSSDVNEEISLEMHGAAADSEDEESIDYLTNLAGEYELDPNEYDTWAELAETLVEAGAEADEEEEEEPQAEDEETEDEEQDEDEDQDETEEEVENLDALADLADDQEDAEAQDRLTELAGEYELDPDDYGTWQELADAIRESGYGEDEEESSYSDWTLKDLKARCKELDLPTTGTKDELIERLEEYDQTDPFKE